MANENGGRGNSNSPIFAMVMGLVLMFVGLFMVATVADINPNLKELSFSAVSNTSTLGINGTPNDGNYTYALALSDVLSATNTWFLVGIMNNTGAGGNGTVNVSINRVSVASISVPATYAETNVTGYSNLVANVDNNITFELVNGNVEEYPAYASNITLLYASSQVNTAYGDINDSLITNTGAVFSVIGLVLIIYGLAYAIVNLRRDVF